MIAYEHLYGVLLACQVDVHMVIVMHVILRTQNIIIVLCLYLHTIQGGKTIGMVNVFYFLYKSKQKGHTKGAVCKS